MKVSGVMPSCAVVAGRCQCPCLCSPPHVYMLDKWGIQKEDFRRTGSLQISITFHIFLHDLNSGQWCTIPYSAYRVRHFFHYKPDLIGGDELHTRPRKMQNLSISLLCPHLPSLHLTLPREQIVHLLYRAEIYLWSLPLLTGDVVFVRLHNKPVCQITASMWIMDAICAIEAWCVNQQRLPTRYSINFFIGDCKLKNWSLKN